MRLPCRAGHAYAFVVAVGLVLGLVRGQDVDFSRVPMSGFTSHDPISIGTVPTGGRASSTAMVPGPVYFAGTRTDEGEVGAVFVYTLKDDGNPVAGWKVSSTLVPGDSVPDTEFGMAGMEATTTIDGHVALVVGAPKHTHGGTNAGAAWVFHPSDRSKPTGPWQAGVMLVPASPRAGALCGHAVAASPTAIAVGCPGMDAVCVPRCCHATPPTVPLPAIAGLTVRSQPPLMAAG